MTKISKVFQKIKAEAEAARDKYGEDLTHEQEFLLKNELVAIVHKYQDDPEVQEFLQYLMAEQIYETYENKITEGWSTEKVVEEYFKTLKQQNN
jgi:hypothetical protein